MNAIQMTGDNILVVPDSGDTLTPPPLSQGTVRAAGPNSSVDLDVVVLFRADGAVAYDWDGLGCFIMKAFNVVAVLG